MQLNVSTLERGTSGGDASGKKNTDRADGQGVGGSWRVEKNLSSGWTTLNSGRFVDDKCESPVAYKSRGNHHHPPSVRFEALH